MGSLDQARKLADHVYNGVDIQTVMQLNNSGYTLEQIVALLDQHREKVGATD